MIVNLIKKIFLELFEMRKVYFYQEVRKYAKKNFKENLTLLSTYETFILGQTIMFIN